LGKQGGALAHETRERGEVADVWAMADSWVQLAYWSSP
jgi:hypothetical protein